MAGLIFASLLVAPSAWATNPQESAALRTLYHLTNGDNWTDRSGWDDPVSGVNGSPGAECGWHGVTCDGSGNVTKIDLSGNNLTGLTSAPTTPLIDLTNLVELNLSSNHISGVIPSELLSLSSLQKLDLSDNQFNGQVSGIGGLFSIVELNVSGNQLSGQLPDIYPPSNPALQYFYASGNQFTGDVPYLSGPPSLVWYEVADNQLDGEILGFSVLPNFQIFRARDNQLINSIPSGLSALTELAEFDVYNNQLTGPIPSLSALTKLRWFTVQKNQLSGPIPSLAGLTDLEVFSVSENQLTGPLPSLDGLGVKLIDFIADHNALSGPIPSFDNLMPSGVPGAPALEWFTVNEMSGSGLTGPIPSIQGLVNLQYFWIGGNQISGQHLPEPPPSLLSGGSILCPNALEIHADDPYNMAWNDATGVSPWWYGTGDGTGPDACTGGKYVGGAERSALTDLYIATDGDNWLVNDNWQDGFGNFSPSGSECSWQGVYCDAYGLFVESLILDSNNLVGSLPSSLGALTQVQALDVHANQLSGPVPASLTSMSSLQFINIADNQLSGNLPAPPPTLLGPPYASIVCPNDFNPIPNPAWDAATGVTPWYQGCTSIPPQTGIPGDERSVLEELYVSTEGDNWDDNTNWLGPSGSECDWYGVICNADGNHVIGISLSGNNLQGSLPDSINQLSQLEFFLVDHNGIGGAVPSFSGLSRLERLWLGDNQFEGVLPGLQGLGNLRELRLGNNHLSGQMPGVPVPNRLQAAGSVLCPNDFEPLPDTAWNGATGVVPWYRDCASVVNASANVDDGFAPDPDDEVRAIAVQADGRVIVGGSFTTIAGATRTRIARLLPDGSIDPSFEDPGVNGTVNAIVLLADGSVVIGGNFTEVDGVPRAHLARLTDCGCLDAGFDPGADGEVRALLLQKDGGLVVGGAFTHIAGAARAGLARLDANGALDAGFAPSFEGTVEALLLQRDGRIVAGGSFAKVNGKSRRNIVRIERDGSLDRFFRFDADGAVSGLALLPDARLLVGGSFAAIGGGSRAALARLHEDGSLDPDYTPNIVGNVRSVLLQADGALLVGGSFSQVNGQSRANLVRLRFDGSLDAGFGAGADAVVSALAQQADDKLLLGGRFAKVSGRDRVHLARTYPDGSLDATLVTAASADPSAEVDALSLLGDGSFVIGGDFSSVGGQIHERVARLLADGRVDAGFGSGFGSNQSIKAVLPLGDGEGRILVGGYFNAVGAQAAANIARLKRDGSLDAGFVAHVNGGVRTIVLDSLGRIVIAGDFTQVDGQPRPGLARLKLNGELDAGFVPSVHAKAWALAATDDGKLLVGGDFSQVSGDGRNFLMRLNTDGTLDTSFDARFGPQPFGTVWSLQVQADGKILAGGRFSQVDGQSRSGLARLGAAQGALDTGFNPSLSGNSPYVIALGLRADGRIHVTGRFDAINNVLRRNVALLNADGSVALGWSADADVESYVPALGLQADGKAVLGGYFAAVGGKARHNLARVSTPDAALQQLSERPLAGADRVEVNWKRSRSSPELAGPPTLLSSIDGDSFSSLERLQRVVGGWSSSPLERDANVHRWWRAQGRVAVGSSGGAGGLVETTRLAYDWQERLTLAAFMPRTIAGQGGHSFELHNAAPHASRDIVLAYAASAASRLAVLPTCTTATVNGRVVVQCPKPEDLGVACNNSGQGERQCAVSYLGPGATLTFFMVPVGNGTPPAPDVRVDGVSVAGSPINP